MLRDKGYEKLTVRLSNNVVWCSFGRSGHSRWAVTDGD